LKYKIGKIAELAGVSKRTVDYYTNLGLLEPVRSERNYRYYSEESLIRLKLIEGLKEKRLTLEEIKERLSLLDGNLGEARKGNKGRPNDIDSIIEQVKQFENQLTQLQPAVVSSLGPEQAAVLTKQMFLQSIMIVNSLLMYINDLMP